MTNSTSLPRCSATINGDHDIKFLNHIDQFKRLTNNHSRCLPTKILVECFTVNRDLARALAQKHPCCRCLSAASSVVLCSCHVLSYDRVKVSGCWASCGCSWPAYTFSFRYIARPRGLRGSMPFTASSITFSGERSII